MADELRKSAVRIDRWIDGLKRSMDPTETPVWHRAVEGWYWNLEDLWEI